MRRGAAVRFLLCAACGAVLASGTAFAEDLQIPRGKGMQCVEPVEIMRKDHMKFILHQRDLTMRQGIRTTRHSLKECVACHVQTDSAGAFVRIDAPGEFCEVCHGFTSTRIDCFECHAARPDSVKTHAGILGRTGLASLVHLVDPRL